MRVLLLVMAGCFTKPAPPGGGDPDAAPIEPGPRKLQHTARSRNDGASLTYTISVQDEPDRYLLVTAQIGGNCIDVVPPIITAEVRDTAMNVYPLVSITNVRGVPCGVDAAHLELYELRSPPAGSLAVTIALATQPSSLHSAAIAFANVDQITPTRPIASATGESVLASVVAEAEPGDLVVNTIGHGQTLQNPGPNQTEIFRTNVDSSNTLNNSGASLAPGAGFVEMTWEAAAVDQWQTIATPLRTAGASP